MTLIDDRYLYYSPEYNKFVIPYAYFGDKVDAYLPLNGVYPTRSTLIYIGVMD